MMLIPIGNILRRVLGRSSFPQKTRQELPVVRQTKDPILMPASRKKP